MKSSKPWLYALLRTFDGIGRTLQVDRGGRSLPTHPARVLMANTGHMGDALLSLGVPRAIRRAFPGTEVDVLTSSEGEALFRHHPDVDRVFVYDHPLLVRRRGSLGRLRQWRRSRSVAGRALVEAGHDLVLELRSYFPNALHFLAGHAEGCLAGFGSGGFGFVLDHEIPHVDGEHEVDRFGRAVRAVADGSGDTIPPGLLEPRVDHLLARANGSGPALPGRPYAVLSPGTRPRKRWPDDRWRKLARALGGDGRPVLVTGAPSERRWLEEVFRDTSARVVAGGTDLVELARLVAGASLYVGVDSFTSHLAAAVETERMVVLWHPFADRAEWAPRANGRSAVLDGSASPDEVLRAARDG